jgi:glycosyltransferase involved in cell wall biosynthesis
VNKKVSVALIGPIFCNGGISSVIGAIANSERIKNTYNLIFFNSSNYKDSSFIINFVVFIKSLYLYLRELTKTKINIAHIHTSYGRSFYRKIFFIYLSHIFKVKIILHIHSSRFEDFFIDSAGFKKKVIEFFLKKVDIIVLLCNKWKKQIENKFALKNVTIIHNPVPLDISSLELNKDRSNLDSAKILFLGFLIRSKGIYDIVEIADKLKDSSFAHKIIICGKGEEEKDLRRKIKEKNLTNIEFLGWVSGQTKNDLLRTSDIFLLPSYKEGMPIAILEAMAFGLPIISTNIAGIPDLVIDNENGYLINTGDISGFVDKIEILIKCPAKRKSFGKRSRLISENFRIDKISESWRDLYQSVIHNG